MNSTIKVLLNWSFLLCSTCFAQTAEEADSKVDFYLDKLEYWNEHQIDTDDDSLAIYNVELLHFLLDYFKSQPASIHTLFEQSIENGFYVSTSPDKHLRVYTWDTQEGGTMRFFNSLIQFTDGTRNGLYHDSLRSEGDNGCLIYEVNQVQINGIQHYLFSSVSIGSSAVYSYSIAAWMNDSNFQLVPSSIIQVDDEKSSMFHYEIDLANGANRKQSKARENMELTYDSENNRFSIPFITKKGKITSKRVVYSFNGLFFKRVK